MPDYGFLNETLVAALFAVGYLLGWRVGHSKGMTDNDGWKDEALWWRERADKDRTAAQIGEECGMSSHQTDFQRRRRNEH